MPSNTWNRIVYRAWAPVYDALLARALRPGRAAAARALALRPGERVALLGIGTGLDLDHLPVGVDALGIDLSPAMLEHAQRRVEASGRCVELRLGDAAATGEPARSFDAVMLDLVLSVVPDPVAVVRETARILRPGGRAVVFDKFAPDHAPPSGPRRALSAVTSVLGTAIDRRCGDLVDGSHFEVVTDEASILRGAYRIVLLRRRDDT